MTFNSKSQREAILNLAKGISRETEDLLAKLEEDEIDEAEEIMDILNDDCNSLIFNFSQLIDKFRANG